MKQNTLLTRPHNIITFSALTRKAGVVYAKSVELSQSARTIALANNPHKLLAFMTLRYKKGIVGFKRWRKKHRHQIRTGLMAIAIVFLLIIIGNMKIGYQKRDAIIQSRQSSLLKLRQDLDAVSGQKATTESQLQQKAKETQDLKAQIKSLEDQLQAKAQAKQESLVAQAVNAITFTGHVSASPACGDNNYANFIYQHESGCSLYDPNPVSGACGIGQAWPCGKLLAVCPKLDYTCENQFFNNYAAVRYGGWANAYSFWVQNRWW